MKAALGAIALGIGAKKLMDRDKMSMPAGMGAAALLAKKKKDILGKKRGDFIKRRMKLAGAKSVMGTTAKSAKSKTFSGYQKVFKTGVSAGDKAKATSTIIGVKPKLPEAAKSSKIARRALKAAQATSLGKRLLPVVAAGVAAHQYLKSKIKKKKEEPKKKMGGGMMNKPMGYNTGGYKSKEDRKKAEKNIKKARSKEGLRSFLSDSPKINQPMKKERYMEGRKARHSAFKKKLGKAAVGVVANLNPVTAAAKAIGKVMGRESKKRDFQKGDYGDISVKKMGGGMMQRPMGYKEGSPRNPEQRKMPRNSQQERPPSGRPGPKAGIGNLPGKKKKRILPIISSSETHSRQKDGSMKMTSYKYSAVGDQSKYDNAKFKTIDSRTYGLRVGGSVTAKCKLGRNKPTKMY